MDEQVKGRGLHRPADRVRQGLAEVWWKADWWWCQGGWMFLFDPSLVPWPGHPDRSPSSSCYGNRCWLGDEPTLMRWNIPFPIGGQMSDLFYVPFTILTKSLLSAWPLNKKLCAWNKWCNCQKGQECVYILNGLPALCDAGGLWFIGRLHAGIYLFCP